MSCEAFTTGADMLLSDQSLEALWCVYETSVGAEFTVGGIGGAIAASYYVHGSSWVVPVVLLVMLSSVFAPQVPTGALSLVAFLLVFGFAAMVMFLIHRSRDDV